MNININKPKTLLTIWFLSTVFYLKTLIKNVPNFVQHHNSQRKDGIRTTGINRISKSNKIVEQNYFTPQVSKMFKVVYKNDGFLKNISRESKTQRIGCRELTGGAQTCSFSGLSCIETQSGNEGNPKVLFLSERNQNERKVPTDDWCGLRNQSSDPRYWGSSRHWPIKENTVVPQHSCLNAVYKNVESFEAIFKRYNVIFYPSIWVVNLDYRKNNHNNHLLMDIIWILDAVLWKNSLQLSSEMDNTKNVFSEGPQHIYLPQGKTDFRRQTSRDVNRFLYAIILDLNISKLYENSTQVYKKSHNALQRNTRPLLDAYPELNDNKTLLFHHELIKNKKIDMVCTKKLTAGAKLSNGGHERVCRNIRTKSYTFFGIRDLPKVKFGNIFYPRPPKRVLILQRHLNRGISNAHELAVALIDEFSSFGVEVEILSTAEIQSAESQVRSLSNYGIVITPHGSQAMGLIWMREFR